MSPVSKRPRKVPDNDSDFEDLEDIQDEKVVQQSDIDDDDDMDEDADEDEDEEEEEEENESEDNDEDEEDINNEEEGDASDESDAEEEEEEEGEEEASEEDGEQTIIDKDAEMEELEKEYMHLRQQEQDIFKNLKQHTDEDVLKGQAVRNQKVLWDKSLEFRFLLQKPFSSSNRLPKDPVKSLFCELDEGVNMAYSDLITSCEKTLDSLLELQEALLENNKSIAQATDGPSGGLDKDFEASNISDVEGDKDWSRIAQMHMRIAPFRDKSIDKWHRKTQVTTGSTAIRGRLQAFNQSISEQVATYMRDPSRMIKRMQLRRSTVNTFGRISEEAGKDGEEAGDDPELLDDSEFYQQLLKEFFQTIDPNSSETAFYALKKVQTKKRKIVDRRASKSRKIRYNVHEKIVNFMAPQPMDLPPMAPKLFKNLFGLKNQKPTS